MDVLITGGEQGLGKAILDQLKPDRITNIRGNDIIHAYNMDEMKALADDIVGESGPFDIIINNFGTNHLSWIGTTSKSDAFIMEANVMLPYWIINAAVKWERPCRVLNISSMTYRVPQRCTSLYCASKAALSQMTKVMARELAPKGWQINAFAPGKILGTRMTAMVDAQVLDLRGWEREDADEYAKGLVPMGRFMLLEEAADIAVYTLTAPSYINGTTIEAFGGL